MHKIAKLLNVSTERREEEEEKERQTDRARLGSGERKKSKLNSFILYLFIYPQF